MLKEYQWSEKQASGIDQIDSEHREIIISLNNLIDTPLKQISKEEYLEKLTELNGIIIDHFHNEEELLAKLNYEDLADHHHDHEVIIDKMSDALMSAVDQSETTLYNLFKTMLECIGQHLEKEDAKYFEIIRDAYKSGKI